MIPPVLMGPLGKILGIGALAIGLYLVGQWHGREAIQQRWDAAITKQAITAAETVVSQAENTAKVEVRYIKVKGATEVVTNTIEKEIVKYVERENPNCPLTPEFVRLFDDISWVYDQNAERVPASGDASGAVDERTGSSIEAVAVLYAHQDAVSQLYSLRNAYDALVEWVRTNHEIDKVGAGHRAVEE